MPRNGSGTFTLVSGNPVVTGTTIESTWANTTLSDIATTLTDSLSRSGQGGMTAALRIADGTQGAPGLGFANETGSGLYRAGTGEVWAVVQGAQTLNLDASGVTVPSDKATSIEGTFVFNETGADKDARFEGDTDANLLFVDASADAVGIGTSSPGVKLEVAGDARLTGANPSLSAVPTSTGFYIDNRGVGKSTVFRVSSASAIDTTAATIDSSGNLGLGVTPSAWGAAYPGRIQGLGWAIATPLDGGTDTSAFATNAYNSAGSTWNYRNNAPAALYQQFSSTHRWYTAPSGTAGNAISFTQAMTLDADGELGIGTTSPSAGLDVRKQETSAYNTARFSNGTDVQFLDVVCGRALTNGTVGGVSSSLVMTLRSSGSSSGHLAFATGNDERARVTQGGDFLVGTSTLVGVGGITLQSITSGFAIVNNNNAAATGYVFESFRRSSTEIGSITQNGTTAVQYNTTSDRRLKDNIKPAPNASDVIDAIEIVSHDWKAAPDEHVTYGVIAQDLALVAPQAVLQGDDGDTVEKPWGVDYSKLVPMLIKEIQSLRARVAALEVA